MTDLPPQRGCTLEEAMERIMAQRPRRERLAYRYHRKKLVWMRWFGQKIRCKFLPHKAGSTCFHGPIAEEPDESGHYSSPPTAWICKWCWQPQKTEGDVCPACGEGK